MRPDVEHYEQCKRDVRARMERANGPTATEVPEGMSAMDALHIMRADYIREFGQPPDRVRVGREFLYQLAQEWKGYVIGGVIEAAHKGDLRVVGMKVECMELPSGP